MSDNLESLLSGHEPGIQQIVRQARDLLLELLPGAVETQDKDNLGFRTGGGYSGLVWVIAPHRRHVTLGFSGGTTLPDPEGLLEGRGRRHRHVKIRSEAELEKPALRALLVAAVEAKGKSS
jgi:hypothetical protein